MKETIAIVISLLCVLSIHAQERMTDRDFRGLKGRVKTVSVWNQEVQPNAESVDKANPHVHYKYSFDKLGNLTRTTELGGGIYFTLNGMKVVKYPRFEGMSLGSISTERNRKVDKRYHNKFLYEYEPNGRIISERIFANDGTVSTFTRYYYDKNGRLERSSLSHGDQQFVTEENLYSYDANGTLIGLTAVIKIVLSSRSGMRPTGEENIYNRRYYDYSFDSKGNWVRRRTGTITTYGSSDEHKLTEELTERTITYH